MDLTKMTKEEFDKMTPEQQMEVRAAYNEQKTKARILEEKDKIRFAMSWELFKTFITHLDAESLCKEDIEEMAVNSIDMVDWFVESYEKHKEKRA